MQEHTGQHAQLLLIVNGHLRRQNFFAKRDFRLRIGCLVIKSLTGSSNFEVGVIVAVISATTIALMLLNGAHSDHTDERALHVAIPLAIMSVGFLGCALLPERRLALLSLALVPIGNCAAFGPFFSTPTRFLTGSAAAPGVALVPSVANVGGLLGPTLIGEMKDRFGTYGPAFMLLGGCCVIAALLALRLRRAAVLGDSRSAKLAPVVTEI